MDPIETTVEPLAEPLIQTETLDIDDLQEQLTECLNRISQLTTLLETQGSLSQSKVMEVLSEVQNLRIEVRNLKEQLREQSPGSPPSPLSTSNRGQDNPSIPAVPIVDPESLPENEEGDPLAPPIALRTPTRLERKGLRKI